MNKQQKTQRASLVPLLTIPDKPLQAKLAVHNILEECGAEVIDSNDPRAVYSGWENKIFPPVFKLLKSDPSVDVSYDDTIGSHYLDISQEHKETIKKRVMKLLWTTMTELLPLTTILQSNFVGCSSTCLA